MARAGNRRVHLVGHSLGGLVAQYSVQRMGAASVTRSVALVSTPHRGIPVARLGLGPAAIQMRTDSMLFRGLPSLDGTGPIRWTVIHGSADILVPVPKVGRVTNLLGY